LVLQISDLLGQDTALCNTLWALKDAAQKTFFDILKGRGEKLLRYPPLVAVDLSPPPAVREGVSVLLEIIENYNSMMVPASGQKPVFDPVISAILDPIIQVCVFQYDYAFDCITNLPFSVVMKRKLCENVNIIQKLTYVIS
jgi:hypothetical protein